MIISKINPQVAKVGFGTTQAQEKKAGELPIFICNADRLPEGYHWEHDIDNDKYIAVKNGCKFNPENYTAEPIVPYTPIIKAQKPTSEKEFYRLAKDEHAPAPGYHIEHDLDGDRFYEVVDGHKLPF